MASKRPCPGPAFLRRRAVWGALLIGALLVGSGGLATPVVAADKSVVDPTLTTLPEEPRANIPFVFRFEGQALCILDRGLHRPEVDRLVVEIEPCTSVIGLPDPNPWSLDIPVPPLQAGAYTVELRELGGLPELIGSWTIVVHGGLPGAPGGIYFQQVPYSEDDLILGSLVGTIDCEEPVILGTRVEGSMIYVDAELPDCQCACIIPQPFAVPFALGPVEPGTYMVEANISFEGFDDPPIPWGSRPLIVEPGSNTVSLQDDRFEVAVDWRDYDDQTGNGRTVPGRDSGDSALFTFFDRANWELMVKVIDGCSFNDHWWVFTAAATDVEYSVTVTDTQTGAVWSNTNPLGTAAPAVNDTQAFVCP